MITEKIFKAYDVRGTVPDELDSRTAYEICRALAATQKMPQVGVIKPRCFLTPLRHLLVLFTWMVEQRRRFVL